MTFSPTARRFFSPLLWIALLALFVLLGPGPLAAMIARALAQADALETFGSREPWTLLFHTLTLCIAVSLLGTLLGTFVGYRVGTTAWAGKNIARAMLLLPLVIPPYLHAVGWTTFFRPGGWASSWMSELFGIEPSLTMEMIYSFGGATVVLALAYCPVAIVFAERSLAWSSPSLVEAARLFGANRWQTFWAARWPFVRIGVFPAAMLIFLLAASDLGVPTILKVAVFNFEVFTQLSAFNDVTTATLLTVPLLGVGLAVVALSRRLASGEGLQAEAGDLQPPPPASKPQTTTNIGLTLAVTLVAFALPVGTLVINGMNPEAFQRMARLAAQPARNTLYYALITAGIVTVGCCLLAVLLRNAPRWRQRLTEYVLVIGFAAPGSILALALLLSYDQPPVADLLPPAGLLIAALVARFAVVAYFVLSTAIKQIPDELLEAAALDGCGPLACTRYLILPMTALAIVGAFSVTFILAAGEIGSTILLYPPGGETLLIALYSIEANSPRSYVAALAVFQAVLAVAPFVVVVSVLALRRKKGGVDTPGYRATKARAV